MTGPYLRCGGCSQLLDGGEDFCPACGKRLRELASVKEEKDERYGRSIVVYVGVEA